MEILLTDMELLATIDEARQQRVADGKPTHHNQAYEAHAICRAQMRKVANEIDTDASGPDLEAFKAWLLRAAGGEGFTVRDSQQLGDIPEKRKVRTLLDRPETAGGGENI